MLFLNDDFFVFQISILFSNFKVISKIEDYQFHQI